MSIDLKIYPLWDSVDPLPSWKNGKIKTSIFNFLESVITQGADFVPEEDRVALFDFDGTLVPEQSMPYQSRFLFKESRAIAKASLFDIMEKVEGKFHHLFANKKEISRLSQQQAILKMTNLDEELLVDTYQKKAETWIETAKHRKFKRTFDKLMYKPTEELIELLQQLQFKVYVISGSEEEFLRTIIPKIMNIAPNHIFGTTVETKSVEINGEEKKKFIPKIKHHNNFEGKVETVSSNILKRPLIAVGNSDGDEAMLKYAQEEGKSLTMIIHHTDSEREFKYGHHSFHGQLTLDARKRIKERGGKIVNMKKEWLQVFPS